MADDTPLDFSITKDPAVQAILSSPALMTLKPDDPQTYRYFGLKSGEGSQKDLIPADQLNFGHQILDALSGGRYLQKERALGKEQKALDAAIIAHQLGYMQSVASAPPSFQAAQEQNPLAYQLSGIQPPLGQNVFPALPIEQMSKLIAAGVPGHIFPTQDVVTSEYPKISAPLEPPQAAAYGGAVKQVPELMASLLGREPKAPTFHYTTMVNPATGKEEEARIGVGGEVQFFGLKGSEEAKQAKKNAEALELRKQSEAEAKTRIGRALSIAGFKESPFDAAGNLDLGRLLAPGAVDMEKALYWAKSAIEEPGLSSGVRTQLRHFYKQVKDASTQSVKPPLDVSTIEVPQDRVEEYKKLRQSGKSQEQAIKQRGLIK